MGGYIETMKRRDQAIQEASRTFAARRKEIRWRRRWRSVGGFSTGGCQQQGARRGDQRSTAARSPEEYNAELAEQRELSDEGLAKNTPRASRRISCRRTRGTTRRWRTWRRSEGDWRRRRSWTRRPAKEDEKLELMTLEERSAELARINKDNEDEYASAQKEVVAHKDLLRTKNELYQLRERERTSPRDSRGAVAEQEHDEDPQLDAQVIRQQENRTTPSFRSRRWSADRARTASEATRRLASCSRRSTPSGCAGRQRRGTRRAHRVCKRAEDDLDEAPRRTRSSRSPGN